MASPKLTIADLIATPLSSSDAVFNTPIAARHSQLVELINIHNHRYHVLDAPIIPDSDYDQLFDSYLILKRACQSW